MVTLPSAPVPALGKGVTPSRYPHLTMTTTIVSSSFLSSLNFWPRRAAASQHSRRCKRSVFLQDHLWCRASRAGCVAQNQFGRHALPSCQGVLGTLCLLSPPMSCTSPCSFSTRRACFSLPHPGDKLLLYVYSQTDGSYRIQDESGFSVYRLPDTEGMFSNIEASYTINGPGWTEVRDSLSVLRLGPSVCAAHTSQRAALTFWASLTFFLQRWAPTTCAADLCVLRCPLRRCGTRALAATLRRMMASSWCLLLCDSTGCVGVRMLVRVCVALQRSCSTCVRPARHDDCCSCRSQRTKMRRHDSLSPAYRSRRVTCALRSIWMASPTLLGWSPLSRDCRAITQRCMFRGCCKRARARQFPWP